MSQKTLDPLTEDAILERRLRATLLQQRKPKGELARRASMLAAKGGRKPGDLSPYPALDFHKCYVESLMAPWKPAQGKPRCADIIRAVDGYYGLPNGALTKENKRSPIIKYKQLAAHLCREMTDRSFPEIARAFAYRDHSSVIYADRRGHKLVVEDIDFASAFHTVRSRFGV